MKKNITKQLILGTVISLGLFSAANAQTAYDDQYYNQSTYNQPQQYQQPAPVANAQQFDYYPDANVYYDASCGRYDYYNGNAWLSVNVLPSNIYLGAKFAVYHKGPQVWLDNATHIRSYRNYRPAYHQPAVVYNNNYRHDDFRRDVVRRDDFRKDNFRDNGRFDNHGGRR